MTWTKTYIHISSKLGFNEKQIKKNYPESTTICYSINLKSKLCYTGKHTIDKSTASIIPRHSNYSFMYKSYRCENDWKENHGGTDNNPKPDLDNINGQITILKQILIISMHIASLVKRPCYILKLTKIWACLGQITP